MAEPNTSYTPGSSAHAQPGHTSGDRSNGNTTSGGGIVDRVRQSAAAQLTSQKDKATEGIGTVVNAVRQSGQQLRSEQHDTLAGYIERAADQIDSLSRRLRDKDVGELLEDAQRFARRQPAVFIGSAFVLGLVAARFLKSSNPDDDEMSWEYRNRSYGGTTAGIRSTGYTSPAISAPSYADVDDDLPASSTTPSIASAESTGRSAAARPSTAADTSGRAGGSGTTAGSKSRRTPGTERS